MRSLSFIEQAVTEACQKQQPSAFSEVEAVDNTAQIFFQKAMNSADENDYDNGKKDYLFLRELRDKLNKMRYHSAKSVISEN